jgi:hypothetical protein
MPRDDFPSGVKNRIARRVNYRCSNPDCRAQTSGPSRASYGPISVGVAAHITAASTRGPRFDSNLKSDDRSSDENGIWLCQTCAKLVDSDEARFTVPLLREWKRAAEAETGEQIGKPISQLASISVLESIHGRLQRESNPRFGFSFVHPAVWDRQDPTNGDGNTYRHPKDSRIRLAAWGQYAVVSPDLLSWVNWTIECLQRETGFCLLARVPAGGHMFDWEERTPSGATTLRQQIEGFRIVYQTEESGSPFTTTQTFLQYGDTQVGLCCSAPSIMYSHYEDLFLVISKELRILGKNSAPFARAASSEGAEPY